MPQDVHGKELQAGDKVMIPATVVVAEPGAEYYNLRVEFDHVMPGYDEKSLHDLNSRQVEKQGDPN